VGTKGQDTGRHGTGLAPKSTLYLTFAQTEGEDNVDPSDAIDMLKAELDDKTSCVIVASADDADFIVELRVVKKFVDIRRAKVTIKHVFSSTTVLETDWVKGTANIYHGYSGTRHAIDKVVKREILKRYPIIRW